MTVSEKEIAAMIYISLTCNNDAILFSVHLRSVITVINVKKLQFNQVLTTTCIE